jgi:pilus assembly protein CpaF
VQQSRLSDGSRKVTSISEITGMEGEIITMQEIFGYRQIGLGADGRVQGHFQATGVRPKFTERLRVFGQILPDAMFDPSRQLQ